MTHYIEFLEREVGFSESCSERETILKAYRQGYVAGQRELFVAYNLPRKFRFWLDQNFTRSENWMRFKPLEDDAPEVLPYSESGAENKRSTTLPLKERALRLIQKNGGSMSRTAFIRSLHLRKVEADKLIGELKPYIRIEDSETLGRPVTIYHYCPNGTQ